MFTQYSSRHWYLYKHLLKVAFSVSTDKFCRLYDVWLLGSTANLWTFNSWPFPKHKGLHGQNWGKQDQGTRVVKKNLETQDKMVSPELAGKTDTQKYSRANMDWLIITRSRSSFSYLRRGSAKTEVSLSFSLTIFPAAPQLTKGLPGMHRIFIAL